MTTIATICARGGSVGVPGKNIRQLCGKPLIVYSIEQALANSQIDAVYVSTDSPAIADIARHAGARVPFLRPAELATSSAAKVPAIVHLVAWVEQHVGAVDRIIDLDPTSPLRIQADLDACLALLDEQADNVITGYEAEKNPYFNMVEQTMDQHIQLVKQLPNQIVSRQTAPKVFAMNASIYVWHRQTLERGVFQPQTRLHVMPRERSIDIDHEIDFQLVSLYMQQQLL
jgi:CMP-N,N'-diacetyllegionaminic acid synthase